MTQVLRRIMIVGQPGSGKSTLARDLGERLGLPVHHMDHVHWLPGWQPRPMQEKDRLCREIEAGEEWIFEGGHSRTYESRAARADLLIWLDVPVGARLWRVLWRSIRWHGRMRPDLPEGCPEQFGAVTWEFWRFIWRTRRSSRARIVRIVETARPDMRVVRLISLREVRQFVDGVGEPRR